MRSVSDLKTALGSDNEQENIRALQEIRYLPTYTEYVSPTSLID